MTDPRGLTERIDKLLRWDHKALRPTAFAAVTIAIVFAARRLNWTRALELLTTAQPGWLVVAIAANVGILVFWTPFWRVLRPDDETPVTYGRMFEIVAAASSLMNTVPFGAGHASSVLLLVRRGETSSRGALTVMALDQLGEGVSKVIVFVLVAILLPLPSWMRAGIITASLAVGALFVTIILVSRMTSELAVLRTWRRPAVGLVCALMMKLSQACAILVVQRAFGLNITMGGTALVVAAIILGTMVPLSPGNLGTYEASAFLAYRYLGVAPEQALSLAIMEHVCFMLPSVGIGYLFLSRHTLLRSAIASR
ncbi:MAG TPA: lysylphosphatidylglycerol synthase transmembrane domain-containing protein [Gemmatimonadaceae bacterium]